MVCRVFSILRHTGKVRAKMLRDRMNQRGRAVRALNLFSAEIPPQRDQSLIGIHLGI